MTHRLRSPGAQVALAGLGCLALGALSLLIPSVPAYDPMAWLIWGREIAGGELNTETGPSWKPFPVLFTTALTAAGNAAPQLWLIIARGAVLAAAVMVFVLASRLAGRLAAAISALPVVLAPWVWREGLRGFSEGLTSLAVLAAVERHVRGRHGQAFSLGVVAALLRPEAWPFLGLYGLWLVWTDRRRLRWVAGGLAVVAVLWLAPEQWGSGNLLRASERAQQVGPESPSLAAYPALTVLRNAVGLLNGPGVLAVLAAVGFALTRRRVGADRRLVLALAGLGVTWLLGVAVMTRAGYSGIERYLIVPVTVLSVLFGPGVMWTFESLMARMPRWRRAAVPALTALLCLAAIAYGVRGIPPQMDVYAYEVSVSEQFTKAVARAGGAERLDACGTLYPNPLLRQRVAWELRRPAETIGELPARSPAVILRTRLNPEYPVQPRPGPRERVVARTQRWEVALICRRGG